jgi:hypothetical protein
MPEKPVERNGEAEEPDRGTIIKRIWTSSSRTPVLKIPESVLPNPQVVWNPFP